MAKRILIVEDEEHAREPLARLLRQKGYEVCATGDVDEAHQALADFSPDVALVDIGLPVLPGDTVANFLNIRYPRTRIIFISGQYSMVDPSRFGDQAVFLRKPLDVDQLLEVIENPSSVPST